MIVAEKCAGTPQGHGKIIGIHRLPKIPRTHCRGIRRSKHPKHKSRAVHHGHDHIHTHRIHRRLHDVLHIGHLQRLNRRGRRRGNRRTGPGAAAPKQKPQNTSDTQGEKDARYEHFVSRAKRLARCHRLAQFVSECHRRIPFVGSTVVRRRSTDLPDL